MTGFCFPVPHAPASPMMTVMPLKQKGYELGRAFRSIHRETQGERGGDLCIGCIRLFVEGLFPVMSNHILDYALLYIRQENAFHLCKAPGKPTPQT